MRKKYIYYFVGLLLVGMFAITSLLTDRQCLKVVSKKGMTNNQMLANYKKNKLERRAAGHAKQDKPDKYLEYLYYLKTGNDKANEYPHNYALKALKNAKLKVARLKSAKAQLNWIERGPGNVGGRTRGFIVDPDDPSCNTWFAGSVGGGIWKTTDAGQNWTFISNDWPNLSVSCMVMAPSNHNVIYAGTGEGFGNLDAILGNGIFKSTDKGVSWNLLPSTEANNHFMYVNRLAIHPDNENVVYAATNTSIRKTIDGGITWEEVYRSVSGGYYQRIQDLRMHPDNPDVLFATVNGVGIVQTIDGGIRWKVIKSIYDGRIELCISKNFPDNIYAMSQESDLYLSMDGGDNWKKSVYSGNLKFLSGQGWYNNTMVAHPADKTKLFVGGVDMHLVTIGSEVDEDGDIAFDIVNGSQDYFVFGDIKGQYLAGGLKVDYSNSNLVELNNIELRFGAAQSQKAHRFEVGEENASIIEDSKYIYKAYTDVPFEVWDTKNNKQLMVSFRDQDANGEFNLSEESIEQIFIHSEEYDASNPSESILVDGGKINANRVFIVYPKMKKGIDWSPSSMRDVKIAMNKIELKSRNISSEQLTHWNADVNASDYAHADHHNLVCVEYGENSFRLLNCNDGGIAMSDDEGISWTSPIKGYVTTQFYGISKHPSKNQYLGGTQDNGTWLSATDPHHLSEWTEAAGGDGFETVWHSQDPNKMAISLYYNYIVASYNGGENWYEMKGIDGFYDENTSPFITRITTSSTAPDMLLVGGKNGISTSYDFGQTWSLVSVPAASWVDGDYNPQIAISPVNSRYIWAGTKVSGSNPPVLSRDGGKSYQVVNTPFSTYSANISEIVAHPTDEKSAYLLFSQNAKPKIYQTKDLGETWEDLSGFGDNNISSNGFPNVAVYSLLVMPHNTNIIWAGTEIGLFESTDAGHTWNYADNGLPAVCIWDMKVVGQQIIVGTHGRGVWTVDFPEISGELKKPDLINAGKAPSNNYAFRINYPCDYDKVEVYADDQLVTTLSNVVKGEVITELAMAVSKSKFGVQVKAYAGSQIAFSDYFVVDNIDLKEQVQKYTNSFSKRHYDFQGNGFNVLNSIPSNYGIHSEHPYVEGKEYVYTLAYPIVVLDDGEKAMMSYRDIAFVESGEAGTQFGDDKYWDYVIVEGTVDGVNWIPLSDGYDVNYSSKWTNYTNGDITKAPNSESLYETHSIQLHDYFEPNDVILIRFRMYSDAGTTGWGWVIDDVMIQEEGTGIFNTPSATEGKLVVSPNPVVGNNFSIELEADEMGEALVTVYGVNGKKEYSRSFQKNASILSERITLGNVSRGLKIITVTIGGQVYSQKALFK